jgi:hypothetical protein
MPEVAKASGLVEFRDGIDNCADAPAFKKLKKTVKWKTNSENLRISNFVWREFFMLCC